MVTTIVIPIQVEIQLQPLMRSRCKTGKESFPNVLSSVLAPLYVEVRYVVPYPCLQPKGNVDHVVRALGYLQHQQTGIETQRTGTDTPRTVPMLADIDVDIVDDDKM